MGATNEADPARTCASPDGLCRGGGARGGAGRSSGASGAALGPAPGRLGRVAFARTGGGEGVRTAPPFGLRGRGQKQVRWADRWPLVPGLRVAPGPSSESYRALVEMKLVVTVKVFCSLIERRISQRVSLNFITIWEVVNWAVKSERNMTLCNN